MTDESVPLIGPGSITGSARTRICNHLLEARRVAVAHGMDEIAMCIDRVGVEVGWGGPRAVHFAHSVVNLPEAETPSGWFDR